MGPSLKNMYKELATDVPGFKAPDHGYLAEWAERGVLLLNATLNVTPLSKVKVVILGQDPYHEPGQAHGMCFSVPHGKNPPPSLKNMYKELEADIPGFKAPHHGHLRKWAEQ